MNTSSLKRKKMTLFGFVYASNLIKQNKAKQKTKKQDQLQREMKISLVLNMQLKNKCRVYFYTSKRVKQKYLYVVKNKQIQKVSTFSLLTDNIQHEWFCLSHISSELSIERKN